MRAVGKVVCHSFGQSALATAPAAPHAGKGGYLRDWGDHLLVVELAVSNHVNTSTGMTTVFTHVLALRLPART